jgi:outer membrane protein
MKNTFLLFFILFSFAGFGQGKLDLATCLAMADTANYSIRNAGISRTANDEQRGVYLAARFPQLNFTGDYKYNAIIPGQVVPAAFFGGAPGTFSTVQFGVPFNLSNSIQLTQVLYNPQVNYGLNALKINSKIVEVQEEITKQDIKLQVATTFFNLQAINKQLSFIDTNLINMEKLIKNSQAMVDQELMVPIEVDKIEINKLSLINAKEGLLATAQQLNDYLAILIGLPQGKTLDIIQDAVMEQSVMKIEGKQDFAELKLIDTQIELNQEEKKGTRMAYLPNLSFYGSYNYNYNMKPEDDFRVGIEGAFIGLRLDWNLFDGLEKYHKLKVNALNAEKLDNQRKEAELQLNLKATNAKRQIDVNSKSVDLVKKQLELAQKVYTQTAQKFEQGVIGSSELIVAENGLQETQTNLVSAYLKLRQSELEYLRTIGGIE